tara:strand:+ start:1539 stop:1760 length:222 start_codon:yes stop_codon:yes gene_type:complete
MTYRNYVEAVGRLIVKGMWFSDAIEVALTVNGKSNISDRMRDKLYSEQFIEDVYVFTEGQPGRTTIPKYSPLF